MVNTHFFSCQVNGNGGAININNALSTILLLLCTFQECSSTGNGGSIYSNFGLSFRMRSVCFYNCTSAYNPAYLSSSGFNLNLFEANFTDEYNWIRSTSPSVARASHRTQIAHYNVSKADIADYSCGIVCGSSNGNEIIIFSQFAEIRGKTIIDFYMGNSALSPEIVSVNFINGTLSSGLVEIRGSYSTPILRKCVFVDINSVKPTYLRDGGSGYASFVDCVFSIPYDASLHSSIPTLSNTFGVANPIINDLALLNTRECWNHGTDVLTQYLPLSRIVPLIYLFSPLNGILIL